jgi:hypothetical protein
MTEGIKIGGKKVNPWVIVAGVGGVGIVAYLYLKNRGSASTASGTTNPLTGLPTSQDNAVDPVTGMTYAAEAAQYGSVQAAEQAVSGGYGTASGYGNTGYVGSSGYPTINGITGNPTTGGNNFSTNAAWAQAVTAGLTGLGYSATDVAAALGLFFAQQPLGAGSDGVSYVSIVQAAEAEYGPPPQGTYAIISSPPAGTTPPPPPPPPPPPGGHPSKPGAITNLRAQMTNDTTVSASWNPVTATATSYLFQITPKDSSPHNIGNRTQYDAGGLKRKTHYTVHVAAVNSAGQGPWATTSFSTR